MNASLLLASCLVVAAASAQGQPTPPRARQWDTVAAFCKSLEARTACRIRVQRGLDELGLIHSPCDAEPARAMLDRIAELTGSLSARVSGTRTPTYELARHRAVVVQEETWRTEPVRRFLAAYVRRAAQIGEGVGDDVPGETDFYLNRRYARIALRYLASLSPEQVTSLLDEAEVRVTAEAVPRESRTLMLREFYSAAPAATGDPIEARVTAAERSLQEHGAGLKLDASGNFGPGSQLLFIFGPPRQFRFAAMGMGRVPVDALAIPLTRRSPYLFLEKGAAEPVADEALAPALRQRLREDLPLPADGSWRQMLAGFGRSTGLPYLSDDYLCREASLRTPNRAEEPVGKKGQVLAQVLDEMCRRFQYVWWYDRGWCYFRSNRWPHDVLREVPGSLLAQCGSALQAKGVLSADVLREMTGLTRRQIEGFSRLQLDLARGSQVAPDGLKEYLFFLGSLSAGDLQSLVGAGLVVPVQADLPLPAFQQLRRGPRASVLLRLEQESRDEAQAAQPGWTVTLTKRAIADEGRTGSRSRLVLSIPKLVPCCRTEVPKPE